ncbi:MAG TPA: hypothetical protein VMD91_03845 [Candidatus Sulfotelmatobacter sp.]|nr:hypothetical protein [Candidatus Sulfotelmatobacter sp.]
MATTRKKKTTRKKTARKKTAGRKKATTRKKTPARKKKTSGRKKKTSGRKKTTRKKRPRRKAPARGGGAATPAPTPAEPSQSSGDTPTPTAPSTPSAPAPASPAQPAGSIGGKAGIRVRMYRVGFGDFFLLSLQGPDRVHHILIDCGVHAKDIGSIGDAVAQMAQETGRHLDLLIVTHRHADHISGFSSQKSVFATFTVDRVWMSWFEDPNNADAVKFQTTLTAVATNLQANFALSPPLENQYLYMAQNVTGDVLGVGGVTSNQDALNTLHGKFGNAQNPPIDYYKAGDPAILPPALVQAGLTAQILGPPIDPNLVSQMNGKGEQYLTATTDDDAPPRRFNAAFKARVTAYPKGAFELCTPDEIAKNIAAAQPDLAIAKAQQADNTLNNQSVIVLFGFNGKKLLFVGDAQWGNWQNFLYGGAVGTGSPQLSAAASSILGNIDFYKVGHHGSTNATPIDALNAMRQGMVAMCSTIEGAYGKVANKSEVPRVPLMAALDKKTGTRVARADEVAAGTQAAGAPVYPGQPIPPLPSIFEPGPGDKLYIDYEL